MAVVVRFTTTRFDLSAERPNPINPIPGESLLLWLRERVLPELCISEPDTEDWGWYSYLDWHGRQYMLGSSASEDSTGDPEWILQVDKQRSLKEKLMGRERMAQDDPCASYILGLLQQEAAFQGISVEVSP